MEDTRRCLECEALLADMTENMCEQCLIFETYEMPKRKTIRDWRETQ